MNILALTDRKNNQGKTTNGVRAAMAMTRLGHKVSIVEHKALNFDAIRAADLIVAFGTLLYLRNVSQAKWIVENKPPNTRFVLWYFDACNPAFRHSQHKVGAMQKIAPLLDHLFMTDHSFDWGQYTRKFTQLMQGIDPAEYNHKVASHTNRRIDVMFTGSHMTIFEEREKMLRQLSAMCSLKWIGADPSSRVVGHDFFMAYQAAKVAFVPPAPACVNNHYWSNRVYLCAGTGTPCLVGYTPGIEQHYEDEKEVIYFRNDTEMKVKLILLLGDTA
ncbi:MAG: glycosyltransferase, partial [Dehalococcoidia bacterium]